MKLLLKKVIEESETKTGKFFDLFIQSLIIISLISFSIETLPSLSEKVKKILYFIELSTVLIFSVEYLLRLYVSDKKLKYFFSFYAIIDLLAIIPFYLSTGLDLRAIRIVRLMRLFRILKILRYSKAIRRFKLTFIEVKEEMFLFLAVTGLIVYLSSMGIYYCEKNAQPDVFKSIFHSFWWAIVTLTTVGYGDTYPITTFGKLFAMVVMFAGIGVVSIPSGLIASALTKIIREEKN